MTEMTKDVVPMEASKPADSTPDAPRSAQQAEVERKFFVDGHPHRIDGG